MNNGGTVRRLIELSAAPRDAPANATHSLPAGERERER